MSYKRIVQRTASIGWGALVAQGISTLAILVLARLFDEAAFGAFALFFIASQLLGASLGLRYEQAILTSADDAAAAMIVRLGLFVATVLAILLVPIAFVAIPTLDRLAGARFGTSWLLVIAAGLLTSYATTLTMWAIRVGRLGLISGTRVGKAMATTMVQISLGLALATGAQALMFGEIAGVALAFGILVVGIGSTLPGGRWAILPSRSMFADMAAAARRHRDLPRLNLPQVIAGHSTAWAIVGIIAASFGPTEAGVYWMMQRVVGLPAAFVGVALSQIFFKEAADAKRATGRFDQALMKTGLICLAVGLPIAIVLIAAGPALFTIMLGPEWQPAGELARTYAPFMVVHLLVSTLTPAAQVSGKLGLALGIGVIQCILMALGVWFGTQLGGTIEAAVFGQVVLATPFMLLMLLIFWRMARTPSSSSKASASA